MTPPAPTPAGPGLGRLCLWVAGYAARQGRWLAAALAAMLGNVLFGILKPWPVLFLVDFVLGQKAMPESLRRLVEWLPWAQSPHGLIGWCIGATVVLFLLGWASNLLYSVAGINLGQRMVYDLASDLFGRLQQLSLRFHASRSAGDNIRRVTADCACVSTIAKDALLPVLSALVSVGLMVGILWRLSPALTLAALAVVPCMMGVFRLYAKPMLDLSCREQELESRVYTLAEQTLATLPMIQAFCREDLNRRELGRFNGEALAATLDLTRVQLRFKLLMGMATAVGTAALWWLGSREALAGGVTVGTILLFLSYLASLYAPVETVMYTTATIQSAGGSALRVWEVLRTRREVEDKPGAAALPALQGRIVFEEVSFGYEPGRPVLRDVRLEIAPGQTVALVGHSGAGKSTLASLVPRFFDPWAGRVLIDGHDPREARLQSLRRQVALVLQDPFLFPLTVAENIAYGRPQASQAEVEEAAKVARAHEFIQRLPQGYQTPVGERGATLSGGERQRLSIARALLMNAPILILDEPTSALDVETEAALVQALRRPAHPRTTLIIAHRFSTIRDADLIVVLDEGRIVERGSHAQLLAAGGAYRRLHDRQLAGPEPASPHPGP